MTQHLVALYPVLRGLIYVALLLLLGTPVAEHLVTRFLLQHAARATIGRALHAFFFMLAFALAVLIAVRGGIQVLTFLDVGDAVTWPLVRASLIASHWGHAWLAQLAAAVILAFVAMRVTSRSAWRIAVLGLLAVIIAAQTGMGHAADDRWPGPIGRVLDAAHLTGAGIWLGTLGVLGAFVVPRLRGEANLPALASVVEGFSWYARLGVALVIASGMTAGLVYAVSIRTFGQSIWGRLLLIKLAVMTGVLFLGWYNWRVVTPGLHAEHRDAANALRRAIRLELALGVVILAITAILVASPLPGES